MLPDSQIAQSFSCGATKEACDEILTQLKGFVLKMKQNHLDGFLNLNMNTDRLDEFY